MSTRGPNDYIAKHSLDHYAACWRSRSVCKECTRSSEGIFDHALKASISELYDSLLDVKGRVLDLDEENRSLRAELVSKDSIVRPHEVYGYFYFKDKMEQPLCPKCFQSQPRNVVFLAPLVTAIEGETYRECAVCHWTKWETPRPPVPRRMSSAQLHNGQF